MEKKEIKISIIMPVYNVENFVAKTIESVLGQTVKYAMNMLKKIQD